MSSRTRISVYLILIPIFILIVVGLSVLGYLYWDTSRHRRTLAADPTQEYWLHVPGQCIADHPCPVFVFVHGTDGSGRDFIRTWRDHADGEGFIVVCPTFPQGYQGLEGGEDEALIAILAEVGQRYPTTEGAIVSGFSGEAQFAHRFAFAHPERTRAVAVHSAGSYDTPPEHTRHIPFLVTVGLNDFAYKLKSEDYDVTVVKIEKVAHKLSKQAIQETIEFLRRVSK
jgi:poly(3-hydroxybutyrate) depolymerase